MSLPSLLKTLNWRWILSISQVVLALALFQMLKAELKVHDAGFEAARAQGWHIRTDIDYVPHAFVWMVVCDLPALVAAALFGIANLSRTGPLFVALAGLFWFWVGRGLEKRLRRIDQIGARPGIVVSILNAAGLLCALALLISLFWAGTGASGLILYGSAVAWSAAFAVYFGTRITRYWRNRRAPSRPT